MSIALERGGGGMEVAGTVRRVSCIPVFEPPDAAGGDRSPATAAAALLRVEGAPGEAMAPLGRGEGEGEEEEEAASSSSSIGRNSDSPKRASEGDEEGGEAEVQSALKGPLDTTNALEEALPIRRGISKFYCGKSKSFTSLADISSSSSAMDLAKPDNAYTRKRKNLLAFSINFDRRRCSPLRSAAGGSVPKRPANSSRSTTSSDGSSGEGECGLPPLRPPPHPNNGKISQPKRCHFTVRSFSLMDLQGATASAAPSSLMPSDKVHPGLH